MDIYGYKNGEYSQNTKIVLDELTRALDAIDEEQTKLLIKNIRKARRVFVVGVGRVLLSLQAIVKRLNHMHIDTYYVGQIDEPEITKEDILIVASGSGNSIFPVAIAKKAKEISKDITVIHIGSNPNGNMKKYSDVMVRIPVKTKENLPDEIESQQAMTTLFEQTLLIYLDIVCKLVNSTRYYTEEQLRSHHANLE